MLVLKIPHNRDFYNSYQDMANKLYPEYEFGIPTYRNVYYHKQDCIFVASYNGHRFAEWHPNKEIHLLFTKNHIASVTTRMNFFPGLSVYSVTKKVKANGERYNVVKLGHEGKSYTLTVYKKLTIKLDGDVYVITPDQPPAPLQKDKDKYTAFNKKLKSLKTCLVAQIKFGTYKDENFRENVRLMAGPDWPIRNAVIELAYIRSLKWIESEDPALLKELANIAFYLSSTSWYDFTLPIQIKAVNALCRNVQVAYLRNECVV